MRSILGPTELGWRPWGNFGQCLGYLFPIFLRLTTDSQKYEYVDANEPLRHTSKYASGHCTSLSLTPEGG